MLVILGVWVDEDICKWCGGITNISVSTRQAEECTYQTIYGPWRPLVLGGVHRSVVRLVVNHEHWKGQAPLRCAGAPNPVDQVSQDRRVLLYDEDDGLGAVLKRVAQRFRLASGEVIRTACVGGGREGRINVTNAHAVDIDLATQDLVAVPSDKAEINAFLRLGPQVVVDTGYKDDESIAGIRRLVDHAEVVGSFSALNVSHDQAAARPLPWH
ncbi:hypothetical protein MP631_18470 [Xanthomonas phaseoli pv. phaseoli]|nr:hypothetical protein MP631_18470 [Xanthomonas phaseoli pv. phaseoli]